MGYLHPEELRRPLRFLDELRDDGDGPEVVALARGPGLVRYDGGAAGRVPAALQAHCLVPDHALAAFDLFELPSLLAIFIQGDTSR